MLVEEAGSHAWGVREGPPVSGNSVLWKPGVLFLRSPEEDEEEEEEEGRGEGGVKLCRDATGTRGSVNRAEAVFGTQPTGQKVTHIHSHAIKLVN